MKSNNYLNFKTFIFLFIALLVISSKGISQTSFSNQHIEIETISQENINSISTESKSDRLSVIVYPNVFTDEINLVFEDVKYSKLIIEAYDISGNKVISKEINVSDTYFHTHIGTEELTPGIYNLKIKSDDYIIDKTITKKG